MPTVSKQQIPSSRQTNQKVQTQTSRFREDESAWDFVSTLRILIYGESGSGKTTTWSTFPGTTLALVCSGSHKPGELKSIDTPENRKRITPKIIRSTEDLARHLQNANSYDNVVLDHILGLQDLLLKETLGIDEIPAVKRWGIATGDHWQEVNRKTIEFLRKLLNLQSNIILISQEGVVKGKEEGLAEDIVKPTVGPAMTPGVGKWLLPACDYVVQTFVRPKIETTYQTVAGKKVAVQQRTKDVEYCLRARKHDVFYTKFRIPKEQILPEAIVNPSYEKILAIIKGEPVV